MSISIRNRRRRAGARLAAGFGLALAATAGDIVTTILTDPSSFYYLDTGQYPRRNRALPIGVFDSGTGGLAVLDAILKFKPAVKTGAREDFAGEGFLFYDDQANMPYSTCVDEKNTPLLIEHIVKDIQFLLGMRYYPFPEAERFASDKQPVKAIVLACNTATAWGAGEIARFLEKANLPLKVIGVIDAGAKGALDTFAADEDGSIGVLATAGTVATDAYGKALRGLIKARGYRGDISIYQQGSAGANGAMDGMPEYINPSATAPRPEYRGPQVDAKLARRFGFDATGNHLLSEGGKIQLNSVENYIAYDVLMLAEQLRRTPGARPLKTVVLGCTTFPFYAGAFRKYLERLYDYHENGKYLYRPLLAREIRLVDPAVNTAEQLYAYLAGADLLNDGPRPASEFYISVPNRRNPEVRTDAQGYFTYAYKYGRRAGTGQEFVRVVPFTRRTVSPQVIDLLRGKTPSVFDLIVRFSQSSPKLRPTPAAERIK